MVNLSLTTNTAEHSQHKKPYPESGAGARKEVRKMKERRLRTPEEVREDFTRRGISIAEWAGQHNLNPHRVYDVLNRRNKGAFGEAHRAAVLLGLKEGVIEERAI